MVAPDKLWIPFLQKHQKLPKKNAENDLSDRKSMKSQQQIDNYVTSCYEKAAIRS